jgi:hypothetical protein
VPSLAPSIAHWSDLAAAFVHGAGRSVWLVRSRHVFARTPDLAAIRLDQALEQEPGMTAPSTYDTTALVKRATFDRCMETCSLLRSNLAEAQIKLCPKFKECGDKEGAGCTCFPGDGPYANAVPPNTYADRAITGPSEESTQICTSDRTAVWSQAVEACAKVAENYVPGPAGHPYEHVKHDICVGIARKLRSLYLSPERVREVYPDLQKPSHAEQTAGGSNLQSTSEPTNAMAPGFYGCRLPPGGCGCPQDVRHKCRHAHWVTSGEPCR